MTKRDKELRQIMQYRADGMEYALRIVKQKGVDALENDLRIRRLTFIPLELSVEWINGLIYDVYTKIISCYNTSVYKTLHDSFGFGKTRLHQFDKEHNETIKDLSTIDGYGEMLYTFTDVAKEYNEKYDMGIDIEATEKGDRNNQNALGAGKVDINYVIEMLQRYEYWDAAQFLEETMKG